MTQLILIVKIERSTFFDDTVDLNRKDRAFYIYTDSKAFFEILFNSIENVNCLRMKTAFFEQLFLYLKKLMLRQGAYIS